MPRALVAHDADEPAWLAERTLRALAPADRARAEVVPAQSLAEALMRAGASAFVLRAGAFGATIAPPRPSATGRPLLALGRTRGDAAWSELLAATGGSFEAHALRVARPPPIDALYTEDPRALAAALGPLADLTGAVWRLVGGGAHRAVRVASLDVGFSRALRALELVTSLHRGGAERIALDLARTLPGSGVEACLAVLDAPRRAAYEAPEAVSFETAALDRAGRVAAAATFARAEGFDVVHAHLLSKGELEALGAGGVPVVTTLHNARIGLPPGVDALGPVVRLAIACSHGVAADVPSIGAPVRVVWNGIAPEPAREDGRARVRRSIGLADSALLLLAVANPRTQKRLDLSVRVLGALRAMGHDVHLAIAGAPLVTSDDACIAERALEAAVEALGLGEFVHRLGSRDDVSDLYAAADVVVSTSAWEGLSLAHLEAVAAGRPLVATATHGTEEIAEKHRGVTLVPVEASAQAIAEAVRDAFEEPSAERRLAPDFTIDAMTRRTALLLGRAVAAASRPEGPIVLVTNNLSTGGAQSSARRLLAELARRGESVRCVVVEEQPEHPTPGRRALVDAGVEVVATSSLRLASTDEVVAHVLRLVDGWRPRALFFWNLVAEVRVRLADALLTTPVFDVSPGEMSYASLERYLSRPASGHPVLRERDYGRLLAGVVAKYEGERARASRLGAPVTVIANGVAVPDEPLSFPPASEHIRLGTLARIAPNKRLDELVAAIRALSPDVREAIEVSVAGPVEPGEEAYAAELAERARDLPISFVGEVESRAFLATIDLFVMVSEPAGCPNASLEAMAAGRAVVATDVGGARDQIDESVGRLVPARDPAAFAAAITELVRDRTRRERLGRAAHEVARARFGVGRMADDYRKLCSGG